MSGKGFANDMGSIVVLTGGREPLAVGSHASPPAHGAGSLPYMKGPGAVTGGQVSPDLSDATPGTRDGHSV